MENGEAPKSPEIESQPKYDVVVILGGNIRKTPNRGWITTSLEEGPEKSIGAHSRTIAAAELFKKGVAKKFIVSTGRTTPDPEAPTEAEVMKTELVRYGVPADDVILEDRSLNTIENLKECAEIIREKGFQKVAIMTSDWHRPRTEVLTENTVKELEAEGRKVTFITPEEILEKKSPRYARIFQKVYGRLSMHQRQAREQSGIQAFKEGKYQSKPGDKN